MKKLSDARRTAHIAMASGIDVAAIGISFNKLLTGGYNVFNLLGFCHYTCGDLYGCLVSCDAGGNLGVASIIGGELPAVGSQEKYLRCGMNKKTRRV